MPAVTLQNGDVRKYDKPICALDVAKNIALGLFKKTVAAEIDGKLVDASTLIERDVRLRLITLQDPEALDIIRHSTAHLAAHAVQLLYPGVQNTIGPVIEDGFFYDFHYPIGFKPEDLGLIEQKMAELAKSALPIERIVMQREEAISFFKNRGEHYKVEIIQDIPTEETLTFYRQGDFTDLCRGPHVPHTGFLKVFKLTKISGAYWRGDANQEMLQRLYGTAWLEKNDLDQYLFRLEEAAKRDHRKLAKQLNLFHQEEFAPGMVFWHANGWAMWQVLEQYIRQVQHDHEYEEIRTPQVVDLSLWERSGHAEKYLDNMFLTHSEKRTFALKPMNCPCHVMVFNQGLKSYRDLPVRYAEFGCCHRNEPSGGLHGSMRVRAFVQDDAHIFCTEGQVESEVTHFMHMAVSIYRDLGLTDVHVKLALRPEKRIGGEEAWDKAEAALSRALKTAGFEYETLPGEGAFYGPKVELHLRDSLGRFWQCGTVQLDFFMPERLGAEYIAEDNTKKIPIMLHRASLGSLERMMGILIEHYAGKFPLWLSPVQLMVCGISEKHNEYVEKVRKILHNSGFRVKSDLRNEKIGYKIREHTLQRVPYLLILGDQEMVSERVSVRTQSGEDLGQMDLSLFVKSLQEEVRTKREVSGKLMEVEH